MPVTRQREGYVKGVPRYIYLCLARSSGCPLFYTLPFDGVGLMTWTKREVGTSFVLRIRNPWVPASDRRSRQAELEGRCLFTHQRTLPGSRERLCYLLTGSPGAGEEYITCAFCRYDISSTLEVRIDISLLARLKGKETPA